MLYEQGDIVKCRNTFDDETTFIILEILVTKVIRDNEVRRYRFYDVESGRTSDGLLRDSSLMSYQLVWRKPVI
jgi:hypothetical protein